MVKEGDYVAIFNSVHRVMKAEKLLKGQKIPMLLIPAPRALTSDCGLAIRYAEADRENVKQCLRTAGLMPEETYVKRGEDFLRLDVK